MRIPQHKIEDFQKKILTFYKENKRDLLWRHTTDPYRIMVSEMILQQTQVSRGLIKYPEFISAFPTIRALAAASLSDVLKVWTGLGYNRRAKYLKQIAYTVVRDFNGNVPTDPQILDTFPGIGPNTAAAIAVYSANKPVVFIETNIRKIYIHEFFTDKTDIDDADILPIVEASLPKEDPRSWYWALMDYGAHLSKNLPNPNIMSRHYVKQNKYIGSLRQIRATVLKKVMNCSKLLVTDLSKDFEDPELFFKAVTSLEKDGLILRVTQHRETYYKVADI